jgi:hypothetical protein
MLDKGPADSATFKLVSQGVRDFGAIKVAFTPGFLFAAFVLEVFSSVMGIPGTGPLSIV